MLHEPGAVPVVTVRPDTPESCLDVMWGSDRDFRNGLKSELDESDIAATYIEQRQPYGMLLVLPPRERPCPIIIIITIIIILGWSPSLSGGFGLFSPIPCVKNEKKEPDGTPLVCHLQCIHNQFQPRNGHYELINWIKISALFANGWFFLVLVSFFFFIFFCVWLYDIFIKIFPFI